MITIRGLQLPYNSGLHKKPTDSSLSTTGYETTGDTIEVIHKREKSGIVEGSYGDQLGAEINFLIPHSSFKRNPEQTDIINFENVDYEIKSIEAKTQLGWIEDHYYIKTKRYNK